MTERPERGLWKFAVAMILVLGALWAVLSGVRDVISFGESEYGAPE